MKNLKYLTIMTYGNALLFKKFGWIYGNELLLLATLSLNVYLGIKILQNIYKTVKG